MSLTIEERFLSVNVLSSKTMTSLFRYNAWYFVENRRGILYMKLQKLGKLVFFGNFENDLYLEKLLKVAQRFHLFYFCKSYLSTSVSVWRLYDMDR